MTMNPLLNEERDSHWYEPIRHVQTLTVFPIPGLLVLKKTLSQHSAINTTSKKAVCQEKVADIPGLFNSVQGSQERTKCPERLRSQGTHVTGHIADLKPSKKSKDKAVENGSGLLLRPYIPRFFSIQDCGESIFRKKPFSSF